MTAFVRSGITETYGVKIAFLRGEAPAIKRSSLQVPIKPSIGCFVSTPQAFSL